MTDDAELLRRYADENAEEAFAELVRRHLGLVYHAALRQCGGDAHRAEDVAQTVFTDLARKADKLVGRAVLAGWLYTSTRYAAAQAVRAEVRRQGREREVFKMNEVLAANRGDADDGRDGEGAWEKLRPVLDEALHALGERDREAVLLRFFEGRAFAEVGARLAVSEDAARVRVGRALEKLREALARRGVTSTSAALGMALAQQAGAAVPAGLAASVTGAALAGVGGVTTSLLAIMSTTKLITVGAVVLALAGIGAAILKIGETRRATEGLATAKRERAELHARLSASEKRAQAAEQNLLDAATRTAAGQNESVSAQKKATPVARGGTAGITAGSIASRSPVDDAVVQADKAKLHRRYDPFLLQQRGLTPAQADRFIELKLEKARIREDVQAAVEKNGVNGRSDGVMALRGQLDAAISQEWEEMLGVDGMKAYNDYEQTSFYRVSFIDPLRPALTATNSSLTAEQEDRLVRIFRENENDYQAKPTDLGTKVRYDWDAIQAQAGAVLSLEQAKIIRTHVEQWKAVIK